MKNLISNFGFFSLAALASLDALAFTIEIPVSKDATLVWHGSDANSSDKNFGKANTVDAAAWNYDAQALFAFNLTSLPNGSQITRAELIIGNAQTYGTLVRECPFEISTTGAQWGEDYVTWNTRPEMSSTRTVVLSDKNLRVDVTNEIVAAKNNQLSEFSFGLLPKCMSQVLIDSKEKVGGRVSILKIDIKDN